MVLCLSKHQMLKNLHPKISMLCLKCWNWRSESYLCIKYVCFTELGVIWLYASPQINQPADPKNGHTENRHRMAERELPQILSRDSKGKRDQNMNILSADTRQYIQYLSTCAHYMPYFSYVCITPLGQSVLPFYSSLILNKIVDIWNSILSVPFGRWEMVSVWEIHFLLGHALMCCYILSIGICFDLVRTGAALW